MIVIDEVHPVLSVSVTVDVLDNDKRYEVSLSFDSKYGEYIVSIPSIGKAIFAKKPWNIVYRLRERKVTLGDAEAIQDIVSTLLLPKLNDCLGQKEGSSEK